MADPDVPAAPPTPAERFAAVVAAFADHANVAFDPGKQRFGSSALTTGGEIFAMVVNDALVVKLPRLRVDALGAEGAGERFVPGHGRAMKEWLVVSAGADHDWLTLAEEALAFVGAGQRP